MEKYLDCYSKRFVKFIMRIKDILELDDETFESLLPSKELIAEDEKQYDKYKEFCEDDMHTHLDMPLGDLSIIIQYPISYYYTYDLLKKGIKGLERYPEEPCYRIRKFYKQDGKEQMEERLLQASFTKIDFLLSTKEVSKRLIKE